jgi:uncharacterized protein (DUF952 family)/RimJ/RimL family protein N-acetyltransferase
MLILRPVQAEDADHLFPMIYNSPVTDTLIWNGPESLDEYRQGLAKRAEFTARGESHSFTLVAIDDVDAETAIPIGSSAIDLEPGQPLRADLGLWIGLPHHGKGYGTLAVRWLVDYGFTRLGLEKIEASIYTGNLASRRIFEKNGFILEGTIRKATLKRGQWQDDWRVGLTREDYVQVRLQDPIFHITTCATWQAARAGEAPLAPASLVSEGYIHCSRADQILRVANSFFPGQRDLILLEIDPRRVQAEIRWEAVENSFFPHIYGPLNIDAVLAGRDFTPGPDGFFRTW